MRSVDKAALAFPLQRVAVCHTPEFPTSGVKMKKKAGNVEDFDFIASYSVKQNAKNCFQICLTPAII